MDAENNPQKPKYMTMLDEAGVYDPKMSLEDHYYKNRNNNDKNDENVNSAIEQPKSDVSGIYNNGDSLNAFKPMTDEELKKQDRKRKGEKIVASVGDAISSIANLFFTTQYAPSTNGIGKGGKPKNLTLIENLQKKYDREDKDYKTAYEKWQKQQERIQREYEKKQKAEAAEAEYNRRLQLNDKYSILQRNWDNQDFINHFFETLDYENYNDLNNRDLYDFVRNVRYKRVNKPKYDALSDTDNEEWEDMFKGKTGVYLKRAILQDLFDGGIVSDEYLDLIGNYLKNFESTWTPIK